MTLPTAIVERIDDLIHAATRDGYFQGREAEYRAAVESDRAALTEAIAAALAPGEAVAWLVLDRNGHRVNVTLRDPSSGPHADGFTLVPLAPAAPAPVLTVGAALALEHARRLVAERDLAAERLAHAAARRDLDAAIAQAEAAEVRAAEGNAFKVMHDSLGAAVDAAFGVHLLGRHGAIADAAEHLAPATVPPGLVEEVRTIIDRTEAWIPHATKHGYGLQTWQDAMRETLKELRDALARHQPAPTAPEAPRYVVVASDTVKVGQMANFFREREAADRFVARIISGGFADLSETEADDLTAEEIAEWPFAVVDTHAPPPAEAEALNKEGP